MLIIFLIWLIKLIRIIIRIRTQTQIDKIITFTSNKI